jgi:hypothetical protein
MANVSSEIDPRAWENAEKTPTEKTLTWRSWGAVALSLFIATICALAALLHVVGVI